MEGDFRIDRWLVQPQLNAIISPNNATVQLEPKVMEVLVYLADRAGEVVFKKRLLQPVLDRSCIVGSCCAAGYGGRNVRD